MNTSFQTGKKSNPVQIGKTLQYITSAVILGAIGLSFVYIKNEQFGLGEKIRVTEKKIIEVRAENEVLLARITEFSSRRVLQQRANSNFISVVQITGEKIARLTPPVPSTEDGILRTALNNRVSR